MQKSSGKTWMFPGDVLQSAERQWLRRFGDGFRTLYLVPAAAPPLFHTGALKILQTNPWCDTLHLPNLHIHPPMLIPSLSSQTLLQSRSHHTQRGRKAHKQDHKYNETSISKGFLRDINENICQCPIPGSVQCQGAESTEQSALVEIAPAHGRGLKLDDI